MEKMNNDEETDWSDLPFDLLSQITEKVISFSLTDYIRFGCVCLQWRSFLIENYEQIKLSSNLPLLLIPSLNYHHHRNYQKQKPLNDTNSLGHHYNYYDPNVIWLGLDHEQRHMNTRSFYSVFDRKVYDFQLPVPSYMNCRGSSHGWLVLVQECCDGTYPVHLLNPFRSDQINNKIQLPPLSTFSTIDPVHHNPLNCSFFLKKAIFSRNPSMSLSLKKSKSKPTTNDDDDDYHEEFVVFGLTDNYDTEFCRLGDRAWTPLLVPEDLSLVFDIIFYKGQFWGILQNGAAVAFDIVPEPKFTIVVNPHPDDFPYPCFRYLVESAGDLFQVRKDLGTADNGYHSTRGFHVFKLNPATMQWVKTNTLDGSIFFLGDNASMSFTVADHFPGWCKPNSIYFTDDHSGGYCTHPWVGPKDMGVFNLVDRSFEPHYTMEDKPTMPAPIWIQPML